MKLWVFQDFKCPRRKCLKEILIRWREWTSIGLVLPSRCALLDWLLKPLNLLQRISSTKIDGNNQYATDALFSSQNFCLSFSLYPTVLFHRNLFSPLFGFLFSSVKASLSSHIPLLSTRRQNRPVCHMSWTSCLLFCWQPSGLCVHETAWHCWDSGHRTSLHRYDTLQCIIWKHMCVAAMKAQTVATVKQKTEKN